MIAGPSPFTAKINRAEKIFGDYKSPGKFK